MWIDEIIVLTVHLTNDTLRFPVITAVTLEELLQPLQNGLANLIPAAGVQLLHILLDLLGVLGQSKQETLQVTGDQDVMEGDIVL